MFLRSLIPAALAVACLTVPVTGAMADGSISDATRATLRADFMRQQAVMRAQSQLGYQRVDLYDDNDIAYLSPASSRYATIDDQIARLAATIAASKAMADGVAKQP